MKLAKSITVSVAILCLTLSHAQWGKWKKVRGDGNITTITRSTGEYEAVKAAGPMDFKLVEGPEGDIKIKADSNLMEYIVTKVKNGKLVIKVKEGINLKPTKTIVITVPYQSIESVTLSGSGDMVNSGTIESERFDVSLAGSGDINLKVNAQSVNSSIAGSGDIKITGRSENLKTKIAGSGDFDGSNLESVNVNAQISGSGDINVVCNGDLTVRVSGSGDVKYSGSPKNMDTKISGSGSVRN